MDHTVMRAAAQALATITAVFAPEYSPPELRLQTLKTEAAQPRNADVLDAYRISEHNCYHGRKRVAQAAAWWLITTFGCSKSCERQPLPSGLSEDDLRLDRFVAHMAYRVYFKGDDIIYGAILILWRLKQWVPAYATRDGHSLMLVAFMLCYKIAQDKPFKHCIWEEVGRGVVPSKELVEAEWAMLVAMDFDVTFSTEELNEFKMAFEQARRKAVSELATGQTPFHEFSHALGKHAFAAHWLQARAHRAKSLAQAEADSTARAWAQPQ